MKRNGFSLIELVLSIVVIAIALMTVPLMLNQNTKSNEYALMQESILAARTKMGNILSFRWDDNASDGNTQSIIRVIDVTGGDSQLDRNTTRRRIGHIREDGRRRMVEVERNATMGQEVANVIDDIDDFNGTAVAIAFVADVALDYLDKNLSLSTTVQCISDDANYSQRTINFDFNVSTARDINTTNIKMIQLDVTSVNRADIPFVFRVFSSNIGQSKLVERIKP